LIPTHLKQLFKEQKVITLNNLIRSGPHISKLDNLIIQ